MEKKHKIRILDNDIIAITYLKNDSVLAYNGKASIIKIPKDFVEYYFEQKKLGIIIKEVSVVYETSNTNIRCAGECGFCDSSCFDEKPKIVNNELIINYKDEIYNEYIKRKSYVDFACFMYNNHYNNSDLSFRDFCNQEFNKYNYLRNESY
jgi:hypothetical protein